MPKEMEGNGHFLAGPKHLNMEPFPALVCSSSANSALQSWLDWRPGGGRDGAIQVNAQTGSILLKSNVFFLIPWMIQVNGE